MMITLPVPALAPFDTSCRFCRSKTDTVMLTADGWQCVDIIDCFGRQPAGDS